MPSNAMCCGKWITLREDGIGFDHDFDCRAFMSDQDPAWAVQRRAVCQQLFDADALCPEIAPYCEPFKEDMQRERSRKRDEAERSASGQWPPASRADDDVWDWIHIGLDLAGLIPALGIIPDAVNAGIYSIEGDWQNAGISVVGMVEGIGQGATATRAAVKVSRKAAKELGKDGLAKAFRNATTRTMKEAAEKAAKEAAEKAAKEVPKTLREVDLPSRTRAAGGRGMKEEGRFFGWEPHHVTKTAKDFTKKELLSRGWTRERLNAVAEGYEHIARITPGNPSAAGRAQQIREIIKRLFD